MRDAGNVGVVPVDEASAARQAMLTQLSATDPKEGIRRAWLLMRESGLERAKAEGIEVRTTAQLVAALAERGVLGRAESRLVLELLDPV